MWNYGACPVMGYGTGGTIFMVLSWIILAVIIILIIRWAVRDGKHLRIRGVMNEDSALRMLRERYAKGEINKEEYEAKKKDLEEAK